MAARIALMAMTIRNLIRVNPPRRAQAGPEFLDGMCPFIPHGAKEATHSKGWF
jgi:hypothetical protein